MRLTLGMVAKPGKLFYGWAIVVALGVTITISYGALSYSIGVFFTPVREETGWSASAMSGAFSLSLLVSGLLGIVVGRLTDRYGARVVMSVGSLLGAAGLALFSVAHGLWLFYLAWGVVIGAGTAASFYPPAFTAVTNWFERKRGKALGILTFLGGFASIIFIPLTSQLVVAFGWRAAARILALIIVAVALPLHALVLRRRPEDMGLRPDGDGPRAEDRQVAAVADSVHAQRGPSLFRNGLFLVLTAGFFFSFLATFTVLVHQLPHLIESGLSATSVATAAGFIGIASLPGRFVLTSLSDRINPALILSGVTALMGLSLFVLMAASGLAMVYLYVLLFGLGFGALQPLRAAVMARHFGRANYGSILGTQGAVLAIPTAAGPLMAGAIRDISGGYTSAFALLAALYFLASALMLAVAARPRLWLRRLQEA
ncbi:MAG: MFS transporter [Dehalococcoidia bacterium]